MILDHPDFSVQPTGKATDKNDLFFHLTAEGKILLAKDENNYVLPIWSQIHNHFSSAWKPFELAHIGQRLILSPHPDEDIYIDVSSPLEYVDFNIFRTLELETASLMAACKHLWSWYQSNRFCGRCGSLLTYASNERALQCTHCSNLLFPTISPAVIVAITCGERILLARSPHRQHYALIAGYVEIGETLEHALRREVKEEVGLDIHNIRYLGNQPWGVSGSHMFAFHANADDQQPLCIQQKELDDARWFERSDVQSLPYPLSIAYELIERFRNKTL